MADIENVQLPSDHSLDYHVITLFQRLESLRKDTSNRCIGWNMPHSMQPKANMQTEIRTLEFWRSIIAECLASFLYVFIVCGAAAGAGVGASVSSVLLATALASGFAITTLTQCFSHISGAHINPSITLGMAVIRAISPLRAAMYITAQCGGGIAGAALLYGVTVPGYQGNLQAAVSHSATLAAWERFGVEFILTFVVVLAYFMSTHSYKSYFGSSALAVGAAYTACSFVSMPYLNPARSLGPSFVLNKWDNHWVYWFGPLVGGAVSGLVYEYIFNPRRHFKDTKNSLDNDSSSMQSEDDLNYDLDMDKQNMQQQKFHSNTYRSTAGGGVLSQQSTGYCQSLYSTSIPPKFEHNEPLYGGTRSLYCKSPPLTRANLNRSQSVYAKSQTAINRDFPRPGPLVPAQSLYPMRVSTQNSHLQNQNVQNQLQQRSESIYGIRGSMKQERPPQESQAFQPVYGTRTVTTASIGDGLCKYDRDPREMRDDGAVKFSNRTHRPDSMYGITGQRRVQSTQSDDSSYGSYHGPPPPSITPPTRNQNGHAVNSDVMNQGGYQQGKNVSTQPERKSSASGSERQGYNGKPPNGSSMSHQYSLQQMVRQQT